jgi:hypothetical protein
LVFRLLLAELEGGKLTPVWDLVDNPAFKSASDAYEARRDIQ